MSICLVFNFFSSLFFRSLNEQEKEELLCFDFFFFSPRHMSILDLWVFVFKILKSTILSMHLKISPSYYYCFYFSFFFLLYLFIMFIYYYYYIVSLFNFYGLWIFVGPWTPTLISFLLINTPHITCTPLYPYVILFLFC